MDREINNFFHLREQTKNYLMSQIEDLCIDGWEGSRVRFAKSCFESVWKELWIWSRSSRW